MTMKFHKDGSAPKAGSKAIFVFGSNLSGVHGAGAARYALQKHGAVYGNGKGLMGTSYAIPTKDKNIESMSLREIKPYVSKFVKFTKDNPEMEFFVTRIGCVLAGYTDIQMAPMFKGAQNCSFAKEWKPFLTDSE
jgi:hypothetical protein